MSLAGGEISRMLLNRVVADGRCHTVLSLSESSKASLTKQILCARAVRDSGRRNLGAEAVF